MVEVLSCAFSKYHAFGFHLTPVIFFFFNIADTAASLVLDLEVNDGSPERPFYMDKSLKRILNKRNIIKNKQEAR